jgi:hypothetical protein
MQQHYSIIYAFFDCYGLSHARSILSKMIKTADAEKIWKGSSPSDVLFFTEKMEELIEAVFAIVGRYDYKSEAVIENIEDEKLWFLSEYQLYCGWHIHSTPWDFFPRHLSKKEFCDPYKALEKFTAYRSHYQWKDVLREFLFHALSPNSISEFDDGTSLLQSYIHLHKLIEATHLIEVRTNTKSNQPHRNRWKQKQKIQPETTNRERETGNR